MLKEESAELVVATSKVTRFGVENFHPDDPEKITNRDNLVKEIGDVLAVIDIILDTPELAITPDEIKRAKQNKLKKLIDFYEFDD